VKQMPLVVAKGPLLDWARKMRETLASERICSVCGKRGEKMVLNLETKTFRHIGCRTALR